MTGPLRGTRVIEIASLAPGPFAATMLADLGAEVLRVDRPAAPADAPPAEPLGRGRRSVAVDLKHPRAAATILALAATADVLIEGFRPGVCERLGIGPDACLDRNPRLVYGRITGWGQTGPLASRAGHDINYLALSGALHPIGPADAPPVPPINYVADFGGGGMMLTVGILAALLERERSGQGQVVDASMVEGAGMLSALLYGLRQQGLWHTERGGNVLDGSAPFYRCYTCADGKYLAVGALEPQFYARLIDGLGITDAPAQFDVASWPRTTQRLADTFATRDRDAWAAHFADIDACVTPVLSPDEAPIHPHNTARASFTEIDGLRQPNVTPRLSRTPGAIDSPPPHAGQHTTEALRDWGFDDNEIDSLRSDGAVA
ncbi:MAG TPA: CaiB/BaiF CoA-transferase family protein [Stackebrandtia sp.]|uniref:CaiB/BaiF CoA transferase family protein n=1 Tax=Stackebrandtia sp. TaxID=2023065 RepID=UPI002D671DC4|nr:CaiB/BaiF CoA-transferase family protein [Stackebrandtia sp.]HZE39240.1 CaiB/BaiF CoA-transferase family protein [Stackebrandtia sp.]